VGGRARHGAHQGDDKYIYLMIILFILMLIFLDHKYLFDDKYCLGDKGRGRRGGARVSAAPNGPARRDRSRGDRAPVGI
jgi:hypothetical protein